MEKRPRSIPRQELKHIFSTPDIPQKVYETHYNTHSKTRKKYQIKRVTYKIFRIPDSVSVIGIQVQNSLEKSKIKNK